MSTTSFPPHWRTPAATHDRMGRRILADLGGYHLLQHRGQSFLLSDKHGSDFPLDLETARRLRDALDVMLTLHDRSSADPATGEPYPI